MTTTFENAQVGDKVYDILLGEGIVEEWITQKIFKVRLLNSPVNSDLYAYYDTEGFAYDINLKYRTTREVALYWARPEIIAPEQPKRKKKLQLVGWINIYRENTSKDAFDGDYTIYSTKREAENSGDSRKLCVVKVTTEEFEVEE